MKPKPIMKEMLSTLKPIWWAARTLSPNWAKKPTKTLKDRLVTALSTAVGVPILMNLMSSSLSILSSSLKGFPLKRVR